VVRAIDCWVNVTMGEQKPPDYLIRVKEDYFKGGDEFFRNLEPDALLEQMDRAGVEKAVITVDASRPSERALRFAEKHPRRFFYAASLAPTGQMREVWALEALVKSNPVVMARVVPFGTDTPPSHPNYFPLYVKCIELDLPVSINTGLPGPPVPGECQNPLHLDRVCVQLPELKLCMAHGADPWWSVAIRLMIKYRNLHLMTSAYAPKYLPAELIHYMNTRGQDKILFASDHPVLSFERCIQEAQALDLREGVLDKFLYANAERLFFSPRKPRGG
jgi:predicted TIM-barrel fold metal-dependent hydrolase